MTTLFNWITKHRFFVVSLCLLLLAGGYYGYTKLTAKPIATQYVSSVIEKGTLIVSISGSGQVAVLNQLDVKPEVSGRITSINIRNGQYVSEGEILGNLDTQDVEKTIRDATVNLESSKLQLLILKESGANIQKLVSDGYNEVANTFLDLPSIITGLNAMLYDNTIASYTNLVDPKDADLVRPLIDTAERSYTDARASYDASFSDYHLVSRSSPQDKIVNFIAETSNSSVKIADAIKNMVNLIDFINDYNTKNNRTLSAAFSNLLTKYKTNLTTYTSEINPHIASLSSIQSSISNAPLNIASQELSIKQRENTLADTKDTLKYYTIHAPFGGIIASTNPKIGDTVSPSTVFATLISSSRYAAISLNEVDVSKVKIGQKATLTFDAIDGYSATGKVIEIDTIGTITQGVVTYNVKVGFDTKDARVKPGMSVTASIITDVRQDVVLAPNAAIKIQGNEHYVELVGNTQTTPISSSTTTIVTERRTVTIGASNDTMTEIVSGLAVGDEVVTRTITPTTQATTQTQGVGGIRIPGLGGTGR
ncbi:MAG: efflux RND transporter periplasmic adaptor subunit [Candidatus Paceibacterota bacterium]|jgi:HlyD family secretion protein